MEDKDHAADEAAVEKLADQEPTTVLPAEWAHATLTGPYGLHRRAWLKGIERAGRLEEKKAAGDWQAEFDEWANRVV